MRKRDLVVPEISELAVIADKIEPKYRTLVLLSAWLGLRFGEAIELRRNDFEYIADSDEPVAINLTRAVTHRSAGDPLSRCRIDTPKGGKSRKVAIPPHIRADIQHHLDTYVAPQPDSLLFCANSQGLSCF
jgi:integrase